MSRSWTLTIPIPDGKVITSNGDHRIHWRKVHAHRRAMKHAAATIAAAAGIPRLARIHVRVTVCCPQWRRIDASNLPGGSTVKAALDALADERHICTRACRNLPGGCPLRGQIVRRGIVADDRAQFMDVAMPTLAPVGPKGSAPRVVVVVTDISEGEAVA